MLMPGNHDRFRNNNGECGSRTFDLIFGNYWGLSDPQIYTAVLRQTDKPPLAIVAADFSLRADSDASHPARWMRYGQGYAYTDLVERLVNKTIELRNRISGIGIIWAIHFPPSKECSGFCGYLELRFHDRVVEAANSSKIKTILAGHVHDRRTIRLGELDIICSGSGCVFAEAHGNWLHSLEIDIEDGIAKVTKKIDYRWVEAMGDFVPT